MSNTNEKITVEEIYVKKFKKISDFHQSFNGQSVIIMGPNESGKTTTASFIRALMGDDSVIPPDSFPEGEIKIKKGDKEYTIRGEVVKGKKKIIVCCDGMEDSRSETLVGICGAMRFKPFEFVEKSKTKAGRKDQVEDIKKLLPEEVQADLARYEADVKAKFDERTELNRDIKNLDGSIRTHSLYHMTEGQLRALKQIDVSSAFAEIQEAEKVNQKISDVKTRILIREEEIKADREEVEELKAKINTLNLKIEGNQRLNNDANSWLDSNKPINTESLKQTIESSQKVNEEYNKAQELIGFYEKKIALEDNVGELTVQIEQGREMVANAVKEMSHILEGISWDDEGLMLNGIPVHPNSLSTSQIINLAYRIKNYENPNSPLFVDCMESMDQEKYDALLAFAKENDLQIIGQEVRRDKKNMEFHLINVE